MDKRRAADSATEDQNNTQWVPIDSLLPADSPRLTGVDKEHTRTLAQTEARLPPIVVHRPSMRVIDGMHRLRAAAIRGDRDIEVRLFEGDSNAAFLLAVQSNVAHGLPLTLADRTAAAKRIIVAYPERSDRAIASATGLSAATVAAIRGRSSVHSTQLNARVGRDGKRRAVNGAEGRRRASMLIAKRPDASLREIARSAGISPATVRDVRARLERGDDPVPPRQRPEEEGDTRHLDGPPVRADGRVGRDEPDAILGTLRRDPSVRFNEAGRALLIWLDGRVIGAEEWTNFIDQIPPHCTGLVMELAHRCARTWNSFAVALEHRAKAAG